MLQSWNFHLPTKLNFGSGRLKELGKYARKYGQRAMLVGYADRSGQEETYSRAAKSLADAGVTVTEFFAVPPDPTAELGAEGARIANEAKVDVIIGLGGGSVIDAAKGIAVIAKTGGEIWDYTGANEDFRPVTDTLPVIAIPTTAGTGTEMTPIAVFTHHGVGPTPSVALKASIVSPLVCPDIAIVDPDLTLGCPARLTAACGADALAHAIESCISRRASPMSWALSGKAAGLVVKNLVRAVENPLDPVPREPMALAATLAGAGIGLAGVVMTHSIAQALGGVLHIPHGEAVAIATPLNLRYNAEYCVEDYARLAHCCGIMGENKEEQSEKFVEAICDLLKTVGLPNKVTLDKDAPDNLAAELARNAFEGTAGPMTINPRPVDQPTLEKLLPEILP